MTKITALATQQEYQAPANTTVAFNQKQIDILKNSICKGVSNEEFEIFLMACHKTQLDPFMRQIYAVKRKSKKPDGSWGETMTIQTGIDGYRLIAERTGYYSPGEEPTYIYDENKQLVSATAYIKKMTRDGTWHVVSASAYTDEYMQTFVDRGTGEKKPTGMWATMPRTMLAKCFDEETEVLTEYGFRKFKDVTGKIMQVTDAGLEAVDVKPFSQDYDGDMICFDGRDLNFCVTPNHDMITTSGRIEAGAMYEQSRARPSFFIPRIVSENKGTGIGFTQAQCELAAATLCDGDYMSSNKFRIKVSRPHKIAKIRSWDLHTKESIRNCAGNTTIHSCGRTITTKNDQLEFAFSMDSISPLVIPYKRLCHDVMMKMNSQEARWFIDAWTLFDGNANSGGGDDRTLRIWTSDEQYLSWLEILGTKAGYSISPRKSRWSDIGTRANYCLSFSDKNEIAVSKWGDTVSALSRPHLSLRVNKNETGKVWCVTVPSGAIIVRRNGFSMLCGNCAEAQALRRAFPAEMSGVYTKEEMAQAEDTVVKISLEQACELDNILSQCEEKYKTWVYDYLKKSYNTNNLSDLPADIYGRMKSAAVKNAEAYQVKQTAAQTITVEAL